MKLILLTTPKTKSYYSREDSMQLARTIEFGDSIQQENKVVLYVNWQKNPDFNRNDFNDANHLNTAGATKLGYKIDSLLNTLGQKNVHNEN